LIEICFGKVLKPHRSFLIPGSMNPGLIKN
jgi:hypothetical protein